MTDFFLTQMGKTFYTHHVPELVRSLREIASRLSPQTTPEWECYVQDSTNDSPPGEGWEPVNVSGVRVNFFFVLWKRRKPDDG